ncbi:MAG: hypothetical protein H7647_10110 [Candidatus Heimdallarchaeota archaeon]|jgi:hypothetical protein|nr:hypothetical protein [Candidatus Heimdallarchaeota archaeon]MCK4254780.1 hypothetical protein [Candidatus Heimdallarchaeota archaeon]
MGAESKLITSYIASIVKKYLPKNEEIIHSGLFLLSTREEQLKIPDWYYNGYSVISETVSSYLQTLCIEKALTFTNNGMYLFIDNRNKIPSEDIEAAVSTVNNILPDCESGIKIIKKANKEFQLKHIGAVR